MDWHQFDQGRTIGTRGSENGLVLRDEEHELGARVTLEQGGETSPFSITCGIYGWMVHTIFFSTQQEAEAAFSVIQIELDEILKIMPMHDDPDSEAKADELSEKISEFVVRH